MANGTPDGLQSVTPDQLQQRVAVGPYFGTADQPAAAPAPPAAPTPPAPRAAAPKPKMIGGLRSVTPEELQQSTAPQAPAQLGMFAETPKNMGWVPWLGERGLEVAAGYGVEALGTLVGGPVGARFGQAAGLTGADALTGWLNHKYYNMPSPDLSAGSLTKDYLVNLGGGFVGEALGRAIPAAFRGIVGYDQLKSGVNQAADEAAGKIAAAQAAMREGKSPEEIAQAARMAAQEARDKIFTPGSKELEAAQQEAWQAQIGRTPEETRAAVKQAPVQGPGGMQYAPGIIQRSRDFLGAMFNPEKRISRNLGNQFEETFKNFVQDPLNPNHVKIAESRAKGFLPEFATPGTYAADYSPQYLPTTHALLNEAMDFGKRADAEKQLAVLVERGVKAGESPQVAEANARAFLQSHNIAETDPTTVGDMLGYRSRLGTALDAAPTSGPDRYVLTMMRRQVDDILGESGVPGAAELRGQWGSFKKEFGDDFYRTVAHAKEPSTAMKMLFDPTAPQRSLMLLHEANPEERGIIRDLYADAVNRKYIVPNADHAEALKLMGYTGDVANPDSWIYNEHVIPQMETLWAQAPKGAEAIKGKIENAAAGMAEKEWNSVVEDARKLTKNMGDHGVTIQAAIDAAPTAEAKGRAALSGILGLNPQEIGTQAGIQKLLTFSPKDGWIMRGMKRRAFNGLMLGPTIVGIGAMASHPLMGASLALSGIMTGTASMGVGALRRAYMWSITRGGPEAAAEMFRALRNPGLQASQNIFARAMLRSTLADATAKLVHPATRFAGVETALNAPPSAQQQEQFINPDPLAATAAGGPAAPAMAGAPAGPGGAAGQLDRMNAEQIAGRNATPERVDSIQDLHHQVAGGATPDIGNDMRTGRLSTPQLKYMLGRMNTRNAANMLRYMSPTDRQHLIALASPEEQQWLGSLY